jgi:hypothetical protein
MPCDRIGSTAGAVCALFESSDRSTRRFIEHMHVFCFPGMGLARFVFFQSPLIVLFESPGY